ncbi:MAG: hypothetical protein EPO32_00680, partial [Anaerolineae bacterium]
MTGFEGLLGGLAAIAKLGLETKFGEGIAGVINGAGKDFARIFTEAYQKAKFDKQIEQSIKSAEARFRTRVAAIDPDLDQLAASFSLANEMRLQQAVAKLPATLDESQLRAVVKQEMELNWGEQPNVNMADMPFDAAARIYVDELLFSLAKFTQKLDEVNFVLIQQLGDRLEELDRDAEARHELAQDQMLAEFRKLHARLKEHEAPVAKLLDYARGQFGVGPSGQISNFIKFYFERQYQTVAFGGRDDELAELTDWLDTGKEQFCLLTAPAGRGKSALLVRWVEGLLDEKRASQRDDLEIIYFPVSIRFSTNKEDELLNALIHPLRRILEDQESLLGPILADRRALLQKYLGAEQPPDRTILIVLDGIDEAEININWGLFSADGVSPNIRILASGRDVEAHTHDYWLGKLGWIGTQTKQLDLMPLTLEGLRDVLVEMGRPLDVLAMQGDVVEPLYELTEQGDPLLVELYINRLLEKKDELAGLNAETLRSWPPGYEGYFEKWEDDQRELWTKNHEHFPATEMSIFKNLLAYAHGRLTILDLHLISAGGFGDDDMRVKDIARAFRRFVAGDGEVEGYIFQHPRLAEYFRGLQKTKPMTYPSYFLAYGARFLREWEQPESRTVEFAHQYSHAIRHYSGYIKEWGSPEDLSKLLCEEWLHAWLAIEKTPAGFLADVERIWEAARKTEDLAIQFRAAHILSRVRSRSAAVPKEILHRALIVGALSSVEIQVLLSQISDPLKKIETTLFLLERLHAKETDKQEAVSTLFELALSIGDEGARAEALTELAEKLNEEQVAEALQAALAIGDEGARANALTELAEKLNEEQVAEALQAALAIGDEGARAGALTGLAEKLN